MAERPVSSVVHMSLWAVSAQMSITLLGAVTSIILNRTLGAEGRGAVGLAMLWPLLLAAFVGAGWEPAYGSCMSRHPHMCRAYFSAGQLTGLAAAALTCCLGWFAIPLLMSESPAAVELARWFLLVIPVAFLAQPAVAGLEALRRYDLSSRVRVGNLLGILCLLVPLAALAELTPLTYCAAHLVTTGLTTAYSFVLFAKVSSGSWRPQWGPLPAYVVRAAPLNWAQVLQLRVDQLVIALLAPADAVEFGAYVVGTTLAGMVSPIAQGLALVLLPESARRAEADAIHLYARMGRLFVLSALVLALPVFVVAPWLLSLFYGPEFAAGGYALRIGLLTALLAGVFAMGLSTIQGTGRSGTATIIGVCSGSLSLLGGVLLLPLLGYLGAAVGQALGLLVGLIVIGAVYRHQGLTLFFFLPRGADVISLRTSITKALTRKRAAPELPLTVVDTPSLPAPTDDPLLIRGAR